MLNCFARCRYWYRISKLVNFHNFGRISIVFFPSSTGAFNMIWQLMTLDIDTKACEDTFTQPNSYVDAYHKVTIILLKFQMDYAVGFQHSNKKWWVDMLRITRRNISQSICSSKPPKPKKFDHMKLL